MKKFVSLVLLSALIALVGCMNACSPAAEKERLTSYDIRAAYDEQNRKVTASMTVDYVNSTESVMDEVYFHLYPQAFRDGARFSPVPADSASAAYPGGMSFGGIEITSLSVGGEKAAVNIGGQDDDILVVPLGEGELYPGDRATIDMDFTLTVPSVRHRFGYIGSTVNLGNWYPIACVYEDGSFVTDPYYATGDPFYSECADYSVTIDVPERLTVAMSGSVSSSAGETGRKIFASELKSARDFAAVIGEFRMLGTAADGVLVNYYYTDDDAPEEKLKAASDAIATFSAQFGAYPYPTFSVVRTHFLQGGMEYPGLVYVSDALGGELAVDAVVHEAAHQWWYAAVGNDQVRYAWMDEGLAEFSASLFYKLNPGYNVEYSRRMSDALSAYILYCDAFGGKADTSMTRKISDYNSNFDYTYLTYVKGELMFESLRNAIGDEKFDRGLREYFSAYRFGVARPDDMIGCFERSAGCELKSFFSSWLDGKVSMYGDLRG